MVCVRCVRWLILCAVLVPVKSTCQLSSYSRNDPWPVYTSLDPHTFLYTRSIQELIGEELVYTRPECMGIHLSPFGQNAYCAADLEREQLPIGDINGRWSMIPLLFGAFPEGVDNYPSADLQVAQQTIYPNGVPGTISVPSDIDPCGALGFISFPARYRKWGMRAEFDFQITTGLGVMLQTGVADICQTVTRCLCPEGTACCHQENTNSPLPTADFETQVKDLLACQYLQIAEQLCLDPRDFHEFGVEDFRAIAYWRRAYPVNKNREGWAEFLATPFVTLGGSFACGREKFPSKVFGVSPGNNGHHSIGASCGIDLDFVETVNIGGEFGLTHFFSRDVCKLPVPTSEYQCGIYPFRTDVTVCPGLNWHFGLKLLARHFLERLSCYFEYLVVTHRQDGIRLKKCDPAYLPHVLEKRSCWQAQVGNTGFFYEISPAITLGVFWQFPIVQRGTYRSTTVLFSFTAFF